MKKIFLIVITMACMQITYAQIYTSPTNNNVGIGTTNPLDKLHVNGVLRWGSETLKSIYSGIDGGGAYLEQVGQNDAESKLRFQTSRLGDGINYSLLTIDPVNGFLFQQIGIGNGNVGIGTATPREKLSVNGKIRAKEVKVEVENWPDYVFKKDYVLPSLTEIEKHIKEKGFLPGMPTAKEVEANGVELGEMNKLLLKKIEELTLVIINQQKQINAIQNKIKK